MVGVISYLSCGNVHTIGQGFRYQWRDSYFGRANRDISSDLGQYKQ
jgi:hypothetical protein